MRKDVILGMTIGGGMLAVVIGYLTLSPNNKHDKRGVDAGIAEVEPGGAGDTAGQTGDTGNAAETKPGTGSKPTLLSGPPTMIEKSDPIWGSRLWAGTKVSVTPGANDTQPPVGPTTPESPTTSEDTTASNGDGAGPIIRTPASGNTDVKGPASPVTGSTMLHPADPATAKMRTHKVQQGENFSTIAATAYGSPNFYKVIVQANPKVDPTRLKPGTEINLPDIATVKAADKSAEKSTTAVTSAAKTEVPLDPKTEYRVVSGDSLHKISVKVYGKISMVDKIYELNKTAIGDNPAKLKLGMILKLPPAPVASTN